MLNLREQQELRFQKGNWMGDRNWSLVRAQRWWWRITWAQWNIQCVLLSSTLDGCQYLRAASLPAGKPSSGVRHRENLGAASGPESEKLSRVAPTHQCYPTCPHCMRAHGRWWSENTGGHRSFSTASVAWRQAEAQQVYKAKHTAAKGGKE